MTSKSTLISTLRQKLGYDDKDLDDLIELLAEETDTLKAYKEAVIDTVNEYHNEQKELITLINEFMTVLSAMREYESDRESYNEKQQQLLWETGSEVIIKALKVLNKN
jgi:hypothetical protein